MKSADIELFDNLPNVQQCLGGMRPFENMSEALIKGPSNSFARPIINMLAGSVTALAEEVFMYENAVALRKNVLKSGIRRLVSRAERIRLVANEEGLLVAMLSGQVLNTPHGLMYFMGEHMVLPEQEKQGLGKRLLTDEIKQTGAKLLGFRTQDEDVLATGEEIAEPDTPYAYELTRRLKNYNYDFITLGRHGVYIVNTNHFGLPRYDNLKRFREAGKEIPGLYYLMGSAVLFAGEIKPIYAEESSRYE